MSTREEQRQTSVGGQKNLGSNRNAGSKSEQELAPENPSVLDKNTQFVRKHETGIFEGKGESAKRQVSRSAATLGRHVSSAKSGAEVSADRSKEVKSIRAKREKETFGSQEEHNGAARASYRPSRLDNLSRELSPFVSVSLR